jgi:hypothetical protein
MDLAVSPLFFSYSKRQNPNGSHREIPHPHGIVNLFSTLTITSLFLSAIRMLKDKTVTLIYYLRASRNYIRNLFILFLGLRSRTILGVL